MSQDLHETALAAKRHVVCTLLPLLLCLALVPSLEGCPSAPPGCCQEPTPREGQARPDASQTKEPASPDTSIKIDALPTEPLPDQREPQAPTEPPNDAGALPEPTPEPGPEKKAPCQEGETRACYPGRQDVNLAPPCLPGRQSCQADGSWSACTGGVPPKQEQCNEKDDDCDGIIDEGLIGCVGTVVGTGAAGALNGRGAKAQLNSPSALALGPKGSLYIADTVNHVIRKVDLPSGEVTTFAGTGQVGKQDGPRQKASFQKPGALAFDRQGNLLVADTVNHLIRKINLQSGEVTTFAGNGSPGLKNGPALQSRFYFPSGLAVTSDGSVFVADTINHMIRKIDPQGQVTTFAGSGEQGFRNGTTTDAQFNTPIAIASDKIGHLYVADSTNSMIRKINPKGEVTTFAGEGPRGFRDGPPGTARFYLAPGVTVGPNGDVYVADAANQRIRRVDNQGNVTTIAGTGQRGLKNGPIDQALFFGPTGIILDAQGRFYVADFNSHSIRTFRLK